MKNRLIYASSIAAVLNAIFVTVITIFAELNEPFKNWLKSLSGHHWTSKSILSIALYLIILVLFYVTLRNVGPQKIRGAISLALWSAVLGSIAIFLFFVGHDMGWF